MNIDWQKYLANELNPDELALANELLRADEVARAELDGLKRFQSQVQNTRDFEPVPIRAIQAKFAKSSDKPRRWPFVAVATACLALTLAVVWIANNPSSDRVEPFVEKKSIVSDPVQAMKFLKSNSMVPIAVLDPGPNGRILGVAAAKNYVKYRLNYKGKTVELMVVGQRKILFRSGIVNRNGNRYFVNSTHNATTIIWRIPGMEFIMKGPAGNELWDVVDELQPKTVTWAIGE